jgi:hypothetical protein
MILFIYIPNKKSFDAYLVFDFSLFFKIPVYTLFNLSRFDEVDF